MVASSPRKRMERQSDTVRPESNLCRPPGAQEDRPCPLYCEMCTFKKTQAQMKQTQTIIAGMRAGVRDDNLNRLQRSEPFQRAEKSFLNRKAGFLSWEEGYTFARGRASADPVVECRLHIMGCCQAAGEGAVLRLFTDPPKSMGDGADISPGSLKHGVLMAPGWMLGYHRCGD